MRRNLTPAPDLLGLAIVATIAAACVYGWVNNIIQLIGLPLDPVSGELVLRAIGIVFGPLGVVMGLFV